MPGVLPLSDAAAGAVVTEIPAEAVEAAAVALTTREACEHDSDCRPCAEHDAEAALLAAAPYLRAQGAELAAEEWERHVYLPGRSHGARIGREVASRLREDAT